MPVNQPVQLDIVVVFTEGVDENLCDFQPTDVKAKLKFK